MGEYLLWEILIINTQNRFSGFLHSQIFHSYMIIRKVLAWKAGHAHEKHKKCNDSSFQNRLHQRGYGLRRLLPKEEPGCFRR
jgi:hypothetical protein